MDKIAGNVVFSQLLKIDDKVSCQNLLPGKTWTTITLNRLQENALVHFSSLQDAGGNIVWSRSQTCLLQRHPQWCSSIVGSDSMLMGNVEHVEQFIFLQSLGKSGSYRIL